MKAKIIFLSSVTALLAATASVLAQTKLPAPEAANDRPAMAGRLDAFDVIGSGDRVLDIPGSAAFVDLEVMANFSFDNIDQAIRRVPGVYFRTEDGFGLFPNISIRGIGSMRTSNLTVMEDGILSAPAPYSNPAAYYTPTTGRMRGIEVIKGSSQVRYGPQITGGVINYLSTAIPSERSGFAKFLYGSENEFRAHTWYGDEVSTDIGKIGYLAELYYRQTDGFKAIDGTAASNRSNQTGFTSFEPMVKLAWEPNSQNYQRWELKVGYTDRDADETYLGLSSNDFRADPFRRYASSRFDVIETEQYRTFLRHVIEPSDVTRISSALYFNDFSRSWYKLHDVRGQVFENGVPQLDANGDPVLGNVSLSQALARPVSSEFAVLRGEGAGSFRVRNNNREYRSYGIQSFIQHSFETGEFEHELELGIRLHEDYEDRFQEQDTYFQGANGAITSIDRGAPGSQDNRRGTARALALSLADTTTYENWTFTPGLRYEHIRYDNNDRRPGGTRSKTSLDVFAFGAGALYRLNEQNSVFANAFRGFAVPGPGAAVDGIDEEKSDTFELGFRHQRGEQALSAEVVVFLTNFRDLIVPANVGGAGLGEGSAENVGRARTQGLELSISWDPGIANGWSVSVPSYLAFTYTDAELRNDVDAAGAGGAAVESIFAGGRKGAKLPYVPEYQISFGTGVELGPLGLYADAVYVDSTFGTASNVTSEQRPDGTADARFGKNDSYFLLDLSARYQVNDQLTILGGANNVLDREYLASRVPHGPRPGQPRFVYGGVESRF